MDVCRQVMPGPEKVEGKDHWVRCHLYGPGKDLSSLSPQVAQG